MKHPILLLLTILILLITLLIGLFFFPLRDFTGEEEFAPQLRGVGHLLSGWLRPYPADEALQPVRYAGLYPFGVNTFLQNETEPDKVERSLDMIADGGFGWIRQEFTWEDLEIHRDDWFVDLRNNEIRNAWHKYDRMVALAEGRELQIIVRLSNPPLWSRAAGNELGAKAPPDFLVKYGDYVEAVVSRYRGRIRYYQVWNEPNCCEEWGRRSVSPEQYALMLEEAYTRAKAADPEAVILTAPLAPTIELVEQSLSEFPPALNDFLFLQRLYDAGAKEHFDILAVQDYGLWSGPTDRRMRPRVINFSRPEYIRDIMIRNDDAHKAIWASEIGWNSTPEESGIDPQFGYAPEEIRGTYLIEALDRQQQEWPWMGVTTIWFFKPTSDEEADQAQYYFKLINPDFTPLPVWETFTTYIQNLQPTLYRGYHQEDHWVLRHALMSEQEWIVEPHENAIFEQAARGKKGDALRFAVEGEALTLVILPESQGEMKIKVGSQETILDLNDQTLSSRTHTDVGKEVLYLPLGALPTDRVVVELQVERGEVLLDGVIVE